MNAKDPRSAAKPPPEPAAPRKRFRIEKLEERIAPMRGGKGTHHCGGSVGGTSSSGGSIY